MISKKILILTVFLGLLLPLAAAPMPFLTQKAKGTTEEKAPDGSTVYQVRTVKNDAGKYVEGHAWSARTALARTETVTIDYRYQPVSSSSRYLLLVSNGKQRLITLVRENNGTLKLAVDKGWHPVGKVKVGEWITVRYVLHLPVGRYDVYLNDMAHPAASGLEFRDPGTPDGMHLWTLGSLGCASVSCFSVPEVKLTPIRSDI